MAAKALIVMGSDSDLTVMQKGADLLAEFGVETEMRICSAHRTPAFAHDLASGAEGRGFGVIIAGAGMAAHLAGVFAASTTLPVIGVPIDSGAQRGVDALYSTAMMPPGIPVATMAIGGAKNAAIFAVQILATGDSALRGKLVEYKSEMAAAVMEKDRKLQS